MEKLYTTRITKTGTSLCVVIPKEILRTLKLNRGDQVVFGFLGADILAIRRLTNEQIIKLKPYDNI